MQIFSPTRSPSLYIKNFDQHNKLSLLLCILFGAWYRIGAIKRVYLLWLTVIIFALTSESDSIACTYAGLRDHQRLDSYHDS